MDMDWKLKVEKKAPGFRKVYGSVRRLAAFHKVDQVDCEGMALVAIVEHPGNIAAAIKAARRALNAERRQRLPCRPIDDRVDGSGDEGEAFIDSRTLPGGKTLTHLDEEGEWVDTNEITDGDAAILACDLDQGNEDYNLPKLSPSNLYAAIIFLADYGFDVNQIAAKTGVTRHRIRQILRDRKAILVEVERATAQPGLPGFECTPAEICAPRKPIKHKPRAARAELEENQSLSLFEIEEEEELV
jgi:hypothetical protein